MAVGVSLEEMLDMLRAEANISLAPGHNASTRDAHVFLLRRVQEELAMQHAWPRLIASRDVPVAAGQRNYEYPEDIDFDAIEGVWAQDGSWWFRLAYGITPEDINAQGAGEGFQSYPPRAWQHFTDNEDQFELWPVPDRAGTIRFRGRKRLAPLVENTDRSTLDATMIVLYAAAELLAQAKSDLAQVKLQKAQAYFQRVRARQSAPKSVPLVVGGAAPRAPRPGIDFIPPGYRNGG